MLRISFLFVCEGSSDAALVSHLEELCLLCGADEASGVAPDLKRLGVDKTVASQLKAGLFLEPAVDLIFVHRDADRPDPEPRRIQIRNGVAKVDAPVPCIPVIPVQETEAWLVLEEAEIRRVAGNPNGRVPLEIPTPREVETIADPKELLFRLLQEASEVSGRKRRRFKRTRFRRRRMLLEGLRCDGPVSSVPAWRRLRQDLQEALLDLRARSS